MPPLDAAVEEEQEAVVVVEVVRRDLRVVEKREGEEGRFMKKKSKMRSSVMVSESDDAENEKGERVKAIPEPMPFLSCIIFTPLHTQSRQRTLPSWALPLHFRVLCFHIFSSFTALSMFFFFFFRTILLLLELNCCQLG